MCCSLVQYVFSKLKIHLCEFQKFVSTIHGSYYQFSLTVHYYIPEIWNFGDVMVLVWTPPHPPHPPPPPHAKACVSRNCDTNARIKFIFDTAIDTLEWKNPIDFGENRKTKMAAKRPFCENMIKKACALHNFIKNAPINFKFDLATDLL